MIHCTNSFGRLKEVILGDAHDKFHKMERLTTLLDGIGAFDESSVIGSKKFWLERLSELNVVT